MDVKLPKVGEAADSGTVATLLVKVGDTVAVDQTLLELEQEKAVAPIRSPVAGLVTAVHVKEGDKISVGARLISVEDGAPGRAPAVASTLAVFPAWTRSQTGCGRREGADRALEGC